MQNLTVSESIVPVTFTLKRGISDNKDDSGSSKNEKRRKWSCKTECSQTGGEISQTTALPGGISSQKLQELIDVRQAELNESNGERDIATISDSKKEKKKHSKQDKTKKSEDADQENNVISTGEVVDEDDSRDDKVSADTSEKEAADDTVKEAEIESAPTNGLSISHLVRPFTVAQLKEELSKFGPVIDEKFWTNKVKSRCCVMYESVEAAQQTRETLHGQHWPSSNPKTLQIKFITEEEYDHIITYDEIKKSNEKAVNGNANKSDRKGNHTDTDEVFNGESKKRAGDKNSGEVNTKSSQVNRDGDNSQQQELDDLFRKTKTKPPLFYLPLNEDQAEIKQKQRKDREALEKENAARKPAQAPRRASPSRKRSPARRSPARHRSRSPRRSSPRHRSPVNRRVSPRRRSPVRDSPPHRRRSPIRNSPPPPPTRRRSPEQGWRSPGLVRRSPGPTRRSPGMPTRRSPGPIRRSPGPMRRSPGPVRRSPGPIRRSPGPMRRSPGPMRRSPGPMRRSPGPIRRSPGPIRRSPGPMRRSPGPIRRSPGPIRRSPGPIRRSPGPIRHSPGPIRRSPGPIRRSPGPIRRSPGPIRRSPGPMRRSPGPVRRPPGPIRRSPMLPRRSPPRGDSPMLARRSRSRTRSRSPLRRRSPARRRSPMLRPVSPGRGAAYGDEPRRVDRYDRLR